MINLEDCIEIGRFTRSHGYKGNIVLKLNNLGFDEIEDMEWVYVVIDGLPVPFFVEEFSEKSNDTLLVTLEDITSIDQTNEILNAPVFIDREILKQESGSFSYFHSKTGYVVIDKNSGKIGVLEGISDDNRNPLILIKDKRKEIYLPLQEEFILDINDDKKEIQVNCPEGLLDVFE